MNFRRGGASAILVLGLLWILSGSAVAQGDLNCDDFGSQAEAQSVFNQNPSDPHGLDGDNDGIACEELRGGGAGADSPNPPVGGVDTGGGGLSHSVLPLGQIGLGGLVIAIVGYGVGRRILP